MTRHWLQALALLLIALVFGALAWWLAVQADYARRDSSEFVIISVQCVAAVAVMVAALAGSVANGFLALDGGR